jgi:hypothetical protein
MAPAVRLQWPTGLAERVALQAELIRRIADELIDFDQFLGTFFLPASGPNAECSDFTNHVLLPFNRDLKRLTRQDLEAERAAVKRRTEIEEATPLPHYCVDKQRLAQLESSQPGRFDLQKLVQLCRELDFCFRNECLLAVAALTRALLDHIPPIFGKRTFAEVANNYGGPKSFQDSMKHLENSARNIGDTHLHVQIRARESLPTLTQVNFSNDLDLLLAEVIRKLS